MAFLFCIQPQEKNHSHSGKVTRQVSPNRGFVRFSAFYSRPTFSPFQVIISCLSSLWVLTATRLVSKPCLKSSNLPIADISEILVQRQWRILLGVCYCCCWVFFIKPYTYSIFSLVIIMLNTLHVNIVPKRKIILILFVFLL